LRNPADWISAEPAFNYDFFPHRAIPQIVAPIKISAASSTTTTIK